MRIARLYWSRTILAQRPFPHARHLTKVTRLYCPYAPTALHFSSRSSLSKAMASTQDMGAKGPQTDASAGQSKNVAPSRLVVCFDGTGNHYQGDTSDTNIVKLYQKFDRTDPNQFHYYQPGIGTYSASEKSVNLGPLGRFRERLSEIIDDGFGTSFDQHVMEGYRFIMRYYDDGDKIYIFGFSRGAFTARFLARMISTIGILSKGNEEMVRFAYKSYQDYEIGRGGFKSAAAHQTYMEKFKTTFCRANAKVYFLGLFDTVNSVGTFDTAGPSRYLPTVLKTADHIRHAVSIDERRLKFKPALLAQDQRQNKSDDEDIEEVFFAGNHGDVGGGWPAPGNDIERDEADDPVQLSDIPFAWMISELREVAAKEPTNALVFNANVDVFMENFGGKVKDAQMAPLHDPLKFGGGLTWINVLGWNLLEFLPIKRLELIKRQWKPVYFPPNMGGTRDIPENATIHPSVIARMEANRHYRPSNKGLENLSSRFKTKKPTPSQQ